MPTYAQRVEGDPEHVGDGRVGLRRDRDEVELREARRRERRGDHAPGKPVLLDVHRTGGGDDDRAGDQALVEPIGDEAVERVARRGEQHNERVHRIHRVGGRQRGQDPRGERPHDRDIGAVRRPLELGSAAP